MPTRSHRRRSAGRRAGGLFFAANPPPLPRRWAYRLTTLRCCFLGSFPQDAEEAVATLSGRDLLGEAITLDYARDTRGMRREDPYGAPCVRRSPALFCWGFTSLASVMLTGFSGPVLLLAL